MRHLLIIATSIFCASLLPFNNVRSETLKPAYVTDPVSLDIYETRANGILQKRRPE